MVTRRVLKNQPCEECNSKGSDHDFIKDSDIIEGDTFTGFVCLKCGCGVSPPHGKYPVGTSYIRPPYKGDDILYVRETWCGNDGKYFYRADGEEIDAPTLDGNTIPFGKADGFKWHPSIHMPKEAARIFLRVTNVRVERLQNITDEQTLLEGVPEDEDYPLDTPIYCPKCKGEGHIGAIHPVSWGYMEVDCPYCDTLRKRFSNLWDSTIKKSDLDKYGWAANPWVWVIEFERIDENV